MTQKTSQQTAMHVSRVSIVCNIILSLLKLIVGIAAHSGAMISDAVHSASDVLSTLIVMIGIRMAGKDSDRDHEYGHERMECVAAILLAAALGITGAGIGYSGVRSIVNASEHTLTVPGLPALIAAVVSIAVKELMFRYTRRAAKKINSSALMADAWHHRSDALSSVGSFLGIAGARMGFPVLDPLASVIICAFIIYAAYTIFRDAVAKMTDRACDEETEHRILEVCASQKDVVAVDLVRTRLFGDRIYVDVEIAVNGSMPLVDAHAAAERTHEAIESAFPTVKHCMVHVNPAPVLTDEYAG